MKVILKEDMKNLGQMGEIVSVSSGYARNYLIPKNLAVEANTKNLKEFEHHKKIIMQKAEKIKESLKSTAGKLSALTIAIKARAGEEDKLYGTVTSMDISEALKAEGFDIDKKKITISEPIKRLGEYSVNIKFHPEISAQVKIHVIKE
ncbi:MAG: 50S ribosomal protein L9 [Nitrospirota bacterium]